MSRVSGTGASKMVLHDRSLIEREGAMMMMMSRPYPVCNDHEKRSAVSLLWTRGTSCLFSLSGSPYDTGPQRDLATRKAPIVPRGFFITFVNGTECMK